jgi:SAM-dependent methyltransferase
VLEVGCVGLPLLLTEFGAAHVHGVDLDPRQVTRAQRRLGNKYDGRIDRRVASAEQLPFGDASFDAVFDFCILHHVPVWQSAVGEVGRVLKPGGMFFFEEVTRAALERWSYRTFLKHPKENRFSEAEFLETLRIRGLRPEAEIRRVLLVTFSSGWPDVADQMLSRDCCSERLYVTERSVSVSTDHHGLGWMLTWSPARQQARGTCVR